MKKKLGLVMAGVLMASSLAACGGSSSSATTAAATTAAATTAAATEAATTAAAAAEATAAAEETTAASDTKEGAAEGSGTIVDIPKDGLTTIKEGTLTIGTSPDFAPYEFYHVENGTPTLAGFDVALGQRIADDLGLELAVVPIDFDGILMELQNGNIDLGISGFSPSPERKESFDFSDIYYTGGQSFVIRAADKDKYKDYAAFKGLPVGAQTGSIQMGLAEENTPDANIIGLAKVTDLISELVSNKLEGAFIETAVAKQYIKNYPELMIAWDVPYDSEGSAIAIKKGNDAMTAAVNAVINNALSDGSMDQYIAEAQELASDEGNVYEGQLDANGQETTAASN
ncbi:MAG: transporter substrate-binding domain-containing protein [Oribacterium sp.]|nr:transporter substrate-binding domain-containing protein [Oribacterium sp.]MDY6317844.1 transporter substrate-binding domain-containing protein [Oribacterium sp.]